MGELRSGSSGAMVAMRVISAPAQHLALTNCAYCSRAQYSQFQLPRESYGMVSVNQQLIFKVEYPLTCLLDGSDGSVAGFWCFKGFRVMWWNWC